MITIHYKTRAGKHVLRVVPDLNHAANVIEALYKARIEAVAFDDSGREVGAAWRYEGTFTWHCQVELDQAVYPLP